MRRVLTGLACVTLLIVAGCAPRAEPPAPDQAAAAFAAPPPPPAAVRTDPASVKPEVPLRQATAEDVGLPLYPGAEEEHNQTTGAFERHATMSLRTGDSVAKVTAWYKAALADRAGMTVSDRSDNALMPTAVLTEQMPNGLRSLSILRDGDKTRIILVELRTGSGQAP
ncbi:MAG TPA: hypothetical protein DCZ72_11570 [Armatimonadetes bacterium]|nr:hypothetical protein [Armatimonadota bacterium]